MKLPAKLALVSLGLLLLPWAGCRYIADMELLLKDTQVRSVTATAQAAAGVVAKMIPAELVDKPPQYVFRGPPNLVIDGYNDDWSAVLPWANRLESDGGASAANAQPVSMRWLVGGDRDEWFVWAEVTDPAVVYPQPGKAGLAYDRLRLSWDEASVVQDAVTNESLPGQNRIEIEVATAAPGWFSARRYDPAEKEWVADERIQGQWQDNGSGFTVELRIRSALPLALGIAYENVDRPDGATASSVDSGLKNPPQLVVVDPSVDEILSQMASPGLRLWAVQNQGWVYGRGGLLFTEGDEPPAGAVWFYWLYRKISSDADPKNYQRLQYMPQLSGDELEAASEGKRDHDWYRLQGERVVLSAAVPMIKDGQVLGAIVAEQADSPIALLTDRAVSGLLGISFVILLLSGGLLFGYASLLSWRIRRLSKAASQAVLPDGRIEENFPVSKSSDELGDLSRSFADLLDDLREYTEYLRTLASKLSHELKTPLAVVRSSLEHLEVSGLDAEADRYRDRASEGANRLASILNAMSEATRLEQSVERSETESFCWNDLLGTAVQGYKDAYPEQAFSLHLPDQRVNAVGMPDLLLQLLDKLVDNAADYAVDGTAIEIALVRKDSIVQLSVSNHGPLLPEKMQSRLFDSLVSLRENADQSGHLGLGLYLCRLIAEVHGGQMSADNAASGRGVQFTLTVPVPE